MCKLKKKQTLNLLDFAFNLTPSPFPQRGSTDKRDKEAVVVAGRRRSRTKSRRGGGRGGGRRRRRGRGGEEETR